ncbi:hypothetical protein K438DRAFT_1831662 [Mycena galopus ATCC 62051]|nr:hypothetical protein K438DRAFT_1831662 [Mycena galopus ATCC 62051]
MHIDTKDPVVQLKITCVVCSSLAVASTIYRLYKRWGRLWADDLWAIFASVAVILQLVGVFLPAPAANKFTEEYLGALPFQLIIWGSRLSILFSIVRVDHSAKRRRRLFWVAVAFVGAPLFLFGQLMWVCESESSWKISEKRQCGLELGIAIVGLVTDIISDAILLFAPLPLFRQLTDKALGRKLIVIFSTSVVATIVWLPVSWSRRHSHLVRFRWFMRPSSLGSSISRSLLALQ